MTTHRVLIVDDEPGIREALKQVLEYEGLEVKTVASGGEALTVYPEYRPHLVFLDVKMAGLDGLETLSRLKQEDPNAVVIMISGHGTIATAVEPTQRGAFDFLEKPLDTDRTLVTLRNALQQHALSDENQRLRAVIDDRYAMVGQSASLKAVQEIIAKVGPTMARVLITGENGPAKELVARSISSSSRRAEEPFVEVNCAAHPRRADRDGVSSATSKGRSPGRSPTDRQVRAGDGGTLVPRRDRGHARRRQAKVLGAQSRHRVTSEW